MKINKEIMLMKNYRKLRDISCVLKSVMNWITALPYSIFKYCTQNAIMCKSPEYSTNTRKLSLHQAYHWGVRHRHDSFNNLYFIKVTFLYQKSHWTAHFPDHLCPPTHCVYSDLWPILNLYLTLLCQHS